MQHLAHFGSLEEVLAQLLASWLAGCWLAGCWLVGLGPQDLRQHAHLRGLASSPGVSRNQTGGTYNKLT